MKQSALLNALPTLVTELDAAGAVLAGEAAAHVHLAVATGSLPGRAVRYSALSPRHVNAIATADATLPPAVERDTGPVADVLRDQLTLFSTVVTLGDGTRARVLTREAVLAELLARGGLAIGLAGMLIHVANDPPVDVDVVREILKAARQGDRFQPLLELLQLA